MSTGSKIAVVGAGAIGSYFGAMLARAGNTVTLIGRRAHVDAIKKRGLHFQSADIDQHLAISASTDIAAIEGADLALFCVKSTDTDATARLMAPHVASDAVILSMQNGVDNAERMRRQFANQVLPVLIYTGANIPEPGAVRHSGGNNLVIGQTQEFRRREPNRALLDEIVALFGAAGLAMKISDDIEAELWTKLVMNCAYNAICALCGAPYGRMVAMPEVRDVMSDVVREVAQVAEAKGIRLAADIVETAMALAEALPQTMSSTAQDIAKGRPTEIDHLNGYVAREGQALGIATPLNRTLQALMKLLEQTKVGPVPGARPGSA